MKNIHFLMVVFQAFSLLYFSCYTSKPGVEKSTLSVKIDSVICFEHYKGIAGGNISRTYIFFITKSNMDTLQIVSMSLGKEKVKGYLDDGKVNTSAINELIRPGMYTFRSSVVRSPSEKFISPDNLVLNGAYNFKEIKIQAAHPRSCINPETN